MLKCFVLLFCLFGCAAKQQTYTGGTVAADHYLASQAGVDILEQGGNAVDAAVATSFALSVVRPFSCGIGGGGFMLIDSPDMEPVALNYRETAPGKVDKQFFETHSSRVGGTAVGVPGTVAGLLAAHDRYGVLTREKVMAPAIRLANGTYKIDKAFRAAVESLKPILNKYPDYADIEFDSLTENKQQAKVLKLISEKGASGFYQGEVAASIIQATSGHLSLDDLGNYAPRWETPLKIDIGGGDVLVAMPPPSSGGVAIAEIVGLLSRLCAKQFDEPVFFQLLIESMKHAFADRAEHLADAAFVDVPVQELLDEVYLDELASRIVIGETADTYSYGSVTPPSDDDGTSHLCVVDKDGMMVSATETINTSFGSLVFVSPFGFMLNNEMDDFSSPNGANVYGLRQSDKNLPEPGKRPLSSMSPTIVARDGVPVLALGASGGPRIISGVVQVLLNILWFGDEPVEALNRGRVHHQWLPDRVYVEENYRNSSIESHLSGIGYEIKTRPNIGVVQVIQVEDGYLKPASDPRKGGAPAGIN
ncbi:MAG: gamma-glutamyltransferase [Phycisphaerales bacterium]|jgi:gamma-glutamyltranspeptidase/glutathione hydrolase|nr:gamma-glutamyltransferase [Phycisphaerales bacterium]